MYSSMYFYNLQKMLHSTTGARLELQFTGPSDPETDLIQSLAIKPDNKIHISINSKCREFAVNSLKTRTTAQVLLHMYDMCRSKEAHILIMKIKNTVAVAVSDSLDFSYVANTISPRCWAWLPEEKKLLLTDLSNIPGLNKIVSHVCLEGHTEWKHYAEFN